MSTFHVRGRSFEAVNPPRELDDMNALHPEALSTSGPFRRDVDLDRPLMLSRKSSGEVPAGTVERLWAVEKLKSAQRMSVLALVSGLIVLGMVILAWTTDLRTPFTLLAVVFAVSCGIFIGVRAATLGRLRRALASSRGSAGGEQT
jgi:hypothetical protein